jgi:hypothetical protein
MSRVSFSDQSFARGTQEHREGFPGNPLHKWIDEPTEADRDTLSECDGFDLVRRLCHRFVHIPAHFCLNLSAAVNVVLAHRLISRQLSGKEPLLPLREMLHEVRGEGPTPAMDEVRWDGK